MQSFPELLFLVPFAQMEGTPGSRVRFQMFLPWMADNLEIIINRNTPFTTQDYTPKEIGNSFSAQAIRRRTTLDLSTYQVFPGSHNHKFLAPHASTRMRPTEWVSYVVNLVFCRLLITHKSYVHLSSCEPREERVVASQCLLMFSMFSTPRVGTGFDDYYPVLCLSGREQRGRRHRRSDEPLFVSVSYTCQIFNATIYRFLLIFPCHTNNRDILFKVPPFSLTHSLSVFCSYVRTLTPCT